MDHICRQHLHQRNQGKQGIKLPSKNCRNMWLRQIVLHDLAQLKANHTENGLKSSSCQRWKNKLLLQQQQLDNNLR
jgi:hypothetical protein